MRFRRTPFLLLAAALALGCGSVSTTPDAGADAAAPADASVDAAPPDAMAPDAEPPADAAPPPVVFDVAYISDFNFSTNIASIGSWGVIVAKGSESIDMTTAQIMSVTDDHPNATVNVTVNTPSTNGTLLPNQYAGSLSSLATTHIIDSNLVTEPRNSMSFGFGMSFQNVPAATTVINVVAVFSVQGTQISIPIIVRLSVGGDTTFNQASRISTN